MNVVITISHLNPNFRSKIAGFDLDHTLIKPKNAKTFSQNEDDFTLYFPHTLDIIQKFYDEGFMIVIITNQSRLYKYSLIEKFLSIVKTPLIMIIGNKDIRKPQIELFQHLFTIFPTKSMSNINLNESFYVGDAGGELGDFSDSDKQFAQNIGIKFIHTNKMMRTDYKKSNRRELIIMMGFPASGKSTYAKSIYDNNPGCYEIISGDELKTEKKIIKKAMEFIKTTDKNIIVDATNMSKKKREPLIELAKQNNLKPVIIYSQTSMDKSMVYNQLRDKEKQIPKIAYYKLRKNMEEPDENNADVFYVGI